MPSVAQNVPSLDPLQACLNPVVSVTATVAQLRDISPRPVCDFPLEKVDKTSVYVDRSADTRFEARGFNTEVSHERVDERHKYSGALSARVLYWCRSVGFPEKHFLRCAKRSLLACDEKNGPRG